MNLLDLNTAKEIKRLTHYTNIDNLKLILENKTWKLTCILGLNDRKEGIRKGINKSFASSFFVASFSSSELESHAMWHIYGNDTTGKYSIAYEKKNKIMISLRPDTFLDSNNYFTDFFILKPEDERVYPNEKRMDVLYTYRKPWFNKIKYRSKNSPIFKKDYMSQPITNVPRYYINTSTLGKYKTKSWLYEDEVRLLLKIWPTCRTPFEDNYLLLRLKDNFFKKMIITASPWDVDGSRKREIKQIVSDSKLPDSIKKSIEVLESTENGLFK